MFKNKLILIISLLFAMQGSSQNLQELNKLKAEYERRQQNRVPTTEAIEQSSENDFGNPQEAQLIPYQPLSVFADSLKNILEHFGYDFFTNRDTVAFWENLPTPPNYLLGPGDEIVVSLWGETQLRKNYIISRDGKIYDEKVGLLNMTGKTIEDAQIYLSNQFSRVYATLKGNSPSSYIDLSLGKLRSINVNFVGEVKYPGVYPIHPFSNILTGLIQAGGVDTTGSLRLINIKRNRKNYVSIDLYDYLLNGNLPENIQLRDQDILVVPVRLSTIKIDSGVVRPGIYEFLPGESIKEVIDFAGGLKPDASSTISLKRITELEKRDKGKPETENYYIDYQNSELTPAQNGDIVTVKPVFKSINNVEIIGQVKYPGIYNFYEGMKAKDLIDLSGGFEDTTFWKSVYQKRGQIVRRNPLTRYENVIEVDLISLKNGDVSNNIKLQNLDRLVIHANLNFFEKKNVQILGEVNVPGSYPLVSDKETLKSLLDRAGKLTPKALSNGISIFRDVKYFENSSSNEVGAEGFSEKDKIRVAWQNESIILMPGDSIIVKESTGTVNVSGKVNNPGLIEFKKGKSLRYYIESAGGLSETGNRGGIVIIHANGLVNLKKWYTNPKISDGATIVVNEKEFSEPFDLTQFATNWTSIITSIITTIILSQQLGQSSSN
tara:strand:- start:13957 stop:15942 length:1986 start_codon:yes stop_codon:yes gene_type:complete